MPILDQKQAEKIIHFEKYVSLISQKFGVNVVFDGVRAETDGKTIFLPNISNMNVDEIEFLRCIVLHETGHVIFTDCSEKYLSSFVSRNHFLLGNAIEDARIENLLMNKFDGASDIFSDLYNDYSFDKKFMNKVFGNAGNSYKDVDEWFAICLLIHQHLIELSVKKDMSRLFSRETFNSSMKFLKKVKTLIDESPIKTCQDVLKLSKTIYDIYFKSKQDKSGKNSIESDRKMLGESEQEISSMQKEAKEMQKILAELYKKIENTQKAQEAVKKEKKEFVKNNKPKMEKLNDEISTINEAIRTKKKISSNERMSENQRRNQEKKQETLDKFSDRLIDLQEQAKNETNEKKVLKMESQIKKFEARNRDLRNKIKTIKDAINQYDSKVKELEKKFNNFPSNIDAHNLEGERGKRKEQIENYNQKLKDYDKLSKDKDAMVQKFTEQYFNEQKTRGQKVANSMKTIQDKLNKNNIPVDIMPQFSPDKDWSESNEIQKNFDKQAMDESGDIVTNGTSFVNSNARDILLRVDATNEKIKSIDLGKIFLKKNKASKLESMNELITEIVMTKPVMDEKGTFSSDRKHMPLTTEFDKVKDETVSNGQEMLLLKRELNRDINQISNIFRIKLKVQKKSRYKGNQEDGTLDSRSLWKVVSPESDNRFFEINNPKMVNKVSASIAIDISGSMEKENTAYGKKLREVALMLSEGLKASFIKHEILGFNAPVCHEMRAMPSNNLYNRTNNNLETVVYKKFQDTKNNGIQNISTHIGDNSDGESLNIIAKRLIKERSRRKILFVLTDGKPYLSGSDVSRLDQDLKNTLELLKKNKVEVFAFGFNEQGKNYYENFCQVKQTKDLMDFCWNKLA